MNDTWDDDKPIPEDADILAAHPINTGRHDLYAEAMRMVGAKRSKGALVDLVNWLLATVQELQRQVQEYRSALEAIAAAALKEKTP